MKRKKRRKNLLTIPPSSHIFHGEWAQALPDISDEDAVAALGIIERLLCTMPGTQKKQPGIERPQERQIERQEA